MSIEQVQQGSIVATCVGALVYLVRLLDRKKGNGVPLRRINELEERLASIESKCADLKQSSEHRRQENKELLYRVNKLADQLTGQSDA